MKPVKDAKTVLTRHWSSWVYYLIAVLAFVPEALGYIGENIQIPPYAYLALVVVGLGAKLVQQDLPPQDGGANANQ